MLGLARLSIYLTKSIHWIFTCAWHWWDGGLWSTQSNVLGSVLRVFKNPWPSCGDWSTLPSYHYSCDIQAKEKSGKGHLKCTCLCDTLRIDWARSPRETRCLRLRAVVKPLIVCWAHITLNPLRTVSTQWWRVMSPTSNVKVQMKSKTRVHKIWGCFWHFHKRQDFNMLCLLISYINNYTKCFCRTAWSCSSGSWWGIKWGLGGKALWGSMLSRLWILLSDTIESLMEFSWVMAFHGSQRAVYPLPGDGQAYSDQTKSLWARALSSGSGLEKNIK